MPVSNVTDSPLVRRRSVRLAAGGLALLSGLGAGSAAAVSIDTVVWTSDNAAYNTFAETCPNKTGDPESRCGSDAPQPVYQWTVSRSRSDPAPTPGSGTIFSWGTNIGDEMDYNSTLTWVNDGLPFTLDQLVLTGNGAVGTGTEPPPPGYPQGKGASPPWEWTSTAFETKVAEAHLTVSLNGVMIGQAEKLLGDQDVVWFSDEDGVKTTRPTPVGFTAFVLQGRTINTGDSITIRLFEQCRTANGGSGINGCWQGWTADGGYPDVQYAPLTLQITDTTAAPVPATIALFTFGLMLLRRSPGGRASKAAATR